MFKNDEKKRAFYVIAILLGMSLILFRKMVFGKLLYVYGSMPQADTLSSYWSYYKYFTEQLLKGQFSFWSFEMGIGTNVLSAVNFLMDPFNLIFLIVGTSNIPYFIVYVAIIKIVVSGVLFYKYIYLITKDNFVSAIASMMFAFSGYMIAWGQHYQFATFYVYISFIFFSFERWNIDETRWPLLLISLALPCASNPYLMFMFSLYLVVYAIIRIIIFYDFNNFKLIILKLSRFGLIYLASILSMFFIFLPTVAVIFDSPRISGTNINIFSLNKSIYDWIALLKVFSQNIFGASNDIPSIFSRWYIYYESPVLYSGLLSIIIIPQIFSLSNRDKRYKLYTVGLIISICSLIFPIFPYIFNMFNAINYRWSFIIVSYNLLIFAEVFSYLIKNECLNINVLNKTIYFYLAILLPICITLIILKAFLILSISSTIIMEFIKVIIFIVLYYFIILSMKFNGKVGKHKKFCLLGLTLVELVVLSSTTIYSGHLIEKSYISNGEGYYDETNKIISFIKDFDEDKFYRISKGYISQSENDPLFQDFRGVMGYNSVHSRSYLEFLDALDISSKANAMAVTTGIDFNNEYILNLLGVKYYIERKQDSNFMYEYPNEMIGFHGDFLKIKDFEGYNLYKNENSLPIGICLDNVISEDDFMKLPNLEKQKALMMSFVTNDDFLLSRFSKYRYDEHRNTHYKVSDVEVSGFEVISYELPSNLSLLSNESNSVISPKLPEVNADKFWIEFEADVPVRAELSVIQDDINSKKVLLSPGLNKYRIPLTYSGNNIKFSFNLAYGTSITFKNIELVIEDSKEVEESIEKLKESGLKINYFSNGHIKGNISADKEMMLIFSIPFDKGWKATVNGDNTPLYKVDVGLVGILLNKGDNDIDISYLPPYFNIGLIISISTILFITVFSIFKKKISSK